MLDMKTTIKFVDVARCAPCAIYKLYLPVANFLYKWMPKIMKVGWQYCNNEQAYFLAHPHGRNSRWG